VILVGTKIDELHWMILNYYHFKFSENFARFRTFGRQQLLNK